MVDYVIKGGTVVDGTGTAPRTADVAVAGDRIVEIGRIDAPGARVIDADGLLVTPGFIDIHTHYDGHALWDPQLDPSFSCGVTTALVGNCGVGFAPHRPGIRDALIDLMEGVEEIPGSVLREGLAWNWTGFDEYLDALDAAPHSFDIGAILPLGPLRLFVLGERAATVKNAKGDDLAEMVRVAETAMAAGAFGLSSTRTSTHQTLRGEMTPDYLVEEEELTALAAPVAKHGGYLEFAPVGLIGEDFEGAKHELEIFERIIRETGVNLELQIIQCNQYPEFMFDQLRWAEKMNATGISRVLGQTGGRGLGPLLGFYGLHPFMDRPGFKEVAKLPREQWLGMLARPEIKARILSEPNLPGGVPGYFAENLQYAYDLGDEMDYEPDMRRNLGTIARETGRALDELTYDLMLGNTEEPRILLIFSNYAHGDLADLYRLMESDAAVVCLSDGGAHGMTVCDDAIYPFMLTHWVRDRKRGPRLPLERVVRMITGDAARAVDIRDRGTLLPGMKADLNVIDFDRLACARPRIFNDLPGGSPRLMQRTHGFRATMVSGTVTRENDTPTGALPGRLIRH